MFRKERNCRYLVCTGEASSSLADVRWMFFFHLPPSTLLSNHWQRKTEVRYLTTIWIHLFSHFLCNVFMYVLSLWHLWFTQLSLAHFTLIPFCCRLYMWRNLVGDRIKRVPWVVTLNRTLEILKLTHFWMESGSRTYFVLRLNGGMQRVRSEQPNLRKVRQAPELKYKITLISCLVSVSELIWCNN